MSEYAKLRRKRQLFVDAYVDCGVGTDALRKLGYAGTRADRQAAKLLANPQVKAAIAERTQEAIARAGARHLKHVEEVALLAYARLSAIRDEDGKPRAFKDLPEELLAAAESIEFESDGRVKRIRLAKTDGLRMLGEMMRAFPQVHEHTGAGGGPIETKEISDLEKARRIAFLLTQGMRARTVLSDPDESAGAEPDPAIPPDSPHQAISTKQETQT